MIWALRAGTLFCRPLRASPPSNRSRACGRGRQRHVGRCTGLRFTSTPLPFRIDFLGTDVMGGGRCKDGAGVLASKSVGWGSGALLGATGTRAWPAPLRRMLLHLDGLGKRPSLHFLSLNTTLFSNSLARVLLSQTNASDPHEGSRSCLLFPDSKLQYLPSVTPVRCTFLIFIS